MIALALFSLVGMVLGIGAVLDGADMCHCPEIVFGAILFVFAAILAVVH